MFKKRFKAQILSREQNKDQSIFILKRCNVSLLLTLTGRRWKRITEQKPLEPYGEAPSGDERGRILQTATPTLQCGSGQLCFIFLWHQKNRCWGRCFCIGLAHKGQLSGVILIPLAWILKTFKIYILRTFTLKCVRIFCLQNRSHLQKFQLQFSSVLLKHFAVSVQFWDCILLDQNRNGGCQQCCWKNKLKAAWGALCSTSHPVSCRHIFFLALGTVSILALSNLLYVLHQSEDINININLIFSVYILIFFLFLKFFWTAFIISGTNPALLCFLNLTSPGLDNLHSKL